MAVLSTLDLTQVRLKLLGQFIKSKRRNTDLRHFDIKVLEPGTRRRRNGKYYLRRSEFSALLGMSEDWVDSLEQGKLKPKMETLKLIAEMFQLSDYDEYYMCGLAGYIPDTPTPTPQQIQYWLTEHMQSRGHLYYPVYCLDYRFRWYIANAAMSIAAGLNLDEFRTVIKKGIGALEILFDTDFQQRIGLNLENLPQLQRKQVLRFKQINIFRRHEGFYIHFLEEMKGHLSAEGFRSFEKVWHEITDDLVASDRPNFPMQTELIEDPVNDTVELWINGIVLKFNIRALPITNLYNTFFIVEYAPQDLDDPIYEYLFGHLRGSNLPYITTWG